MRQREATALERTPTERKRKDTVNSCKYFNGDFFLVGKF
jgi:hypothetical protein